MRHLALVLMAFPLSLLAQNANQVSSATTQFSSSNDDGGFAPAVQEPQYSKSEREAARLARHPIFDDQYHWGLLALVGSAGIGAQIGYPISHHIIVRAGGDFYHYTQNGRRDDTTYGGVLQLGDARFNIDYFPWRERRFHISPLLIFANQTRATAHFNIQPDATFDLEDHSYYGATNDPLRGNARMDFRKTSPGLALGFGNLSHGHGHWLFPIEFGVYYNSTPRIQIDFTGTACNVNQPRATRCQPVASNAQFQSDLQKLRNEARDDLRYARIIPILNYGVGYRF